MYSVLGDVPLFVMLDYVCCSTVVIFNRLWYSVVCDIPLFVMFGCLCYSAVAIFNRLAEVW